MREKTGVPPFNNRVLLGPGVQTQGPYAGWYPLLNGNVLIGYLRDNAGTIEIRSINQGAGVYAPIHIFAGDQPVSITAGSQLFQFTAAGNLDMNTAKIVDLADPTSAQEAATMNYVDSKLDDISFAGAPTRVKNTNYTNGTKIRHVNIVFGVASPGEDTGTAKIASTSPGTNVVGIGHVHSTYHPYDTIGFIVPPSWYYRVDEATGDLSIAYWVEWDEH